MQPPIVFPSKQSRSVTLSQWNIVLPSLYLNRSTCKWDLPNPFKYRNFTKSRAHGVYLPHIQLHNKKDAMKNEMSNGGLESPWNQFFFDVQ